MHSLRPASRAPRASLFLVCVALVQAACGVVRQDDKERRCGDYAERIAPVLQQRCGACHGGDVRTGDFSVEDYLSVVSFRRDGVARVPASDDALLLTAARGELALHKALPADEQATLREWAVDCRAAPRNLLVHPLGWSTPTDRSQFHGAQLRRDGYAVQECQTCHGEDLRGGTSGSDCNACHAQGPWACDTCHGSPASSAPPRSLEHVSLTSVLGVGAHQGHLRDGPRNLAVACGACHVEVQDAWQEGHFLKAGAYDDGVAEVTFAQSSDAGVATWNAADGTCANTYCHRPSATDLAATGTTPAWTAVGGQAAACGTCHGLPPTSHFAAQCAECHGARYSVADGTVERALHVNGRADLRDDVRCDGCHGDQGSPAFFDTLGRRGDAGVRSVGAHDAHLRAGRLRGPMGCEECHQVPAEVMALGHVDSALPAEVFTQDGGVAWSGGARPTWIPAAGTCASVACHGAGSVMEGDNAPGLLRTPSWLGGPSQVACGTCHGVPPQDGTLWHQTYPALTDCVLCHAKSVTASGAIVIQTLPDGGQTSTHADGLLTGN